MSARVTGGVMAALLLAGCEIAPNNNSAAVTAGAATAAAASDWGRFVDTYIAASLAANPVFAVQQGKHDYDGRLPDWSPTGIEAEKARLTKAIADAQAFDAAKMTPEQRFERDYLVAQARGELFWVATADQPHTNPAYYSEQLDPSVYVTVPYAPPATRLKSYTAYLKAVPAALLQVRANLKAPMPLSFVDYAKSAFGGYAEFYNGDGLKAFAGVGTPDEQAALKMAASEAAAAMTSLMQWTESQRATAQANFALGPQRFQQMLYDTEMVDTPISELKRIGQADLAANQAALKQACGRYAPGATIQACMEKMNSVKPEGGAVAGARAQLAGLKQFIIDKDLVSIPGPEEALVAEAPSYNRQNFAYINIPGPYEKNLPSTYYIAPPDPTWPKAIQDGFVPGKADLLFTSVHEIWPGHFLNFLHANRSKFLFGRLFVGYAYAEGWAHYSEEMMRVAGLDGPTDEVTIGQLSNALLRDCRYLSAIGMHAEGMTQAESFTLFREQCYQDEGNARQQAARGTYDPAYLNYTLGKLMIRKLRDDWVASRGGRKAWKAYHDAFLSYGGPPIPLVRAQMMGGAAKAVF